MAPKRRRTRSKSPTPGPSTRPVSREDKGKGRAETPVIQIQILPATPTKTRPSTVEVTLPITPEADKLKPGEERLEAVYISSGESSRDTTPAMETIEEDDDPFVDRAPKRRKPNPPDVIFQIPQDHEPGEARKPPPTVPEELTGRVTDFVPLARNEEELMYLIGSGYEPTPGQQGPLDPAMFRPLTHHADMSDKYETVPGAYTNRPRDPQRLEEMKQAWVRAGVRVPPKPRQLTDEEAAARDARKKRNEADWKAMQDEVRREMEEEEVAVKPRFRPVPVSTGPKAFVDAVQPRDFLPVEPPVEVVDENESDRAVKDLKRQGWEWSEDIVLKNGMRCPPLGKRLETVLNYLREADVDRTLHWEREWARVKVLLEWVEREYDMDGSSGGSMREVSAEVRNMFKQAKCMVKVHEKFEGWQYEKGEGTAIQGPEDVPPVVSQRQPGWDIWRERASHLRLGVNGEKVIGPRKVLVHQPQEVNTLFPSGSYGGKVFHQRLKNDGQKFRDGDDSSPSSNLYLAEDEAYLAFKKWWRKQPHLTVDGKGKLPDPEEVKAFNNPKPVARESQEKMDFPPRPRPEWMTQEEYDQLSAQVDRLEQEAGIISPLPDNQMDLDPEIYDVSDNEQDESGTRYPVSELKRKAEIHGTRRAALQEALRTFTTMANQEAEKQWNIVVRPVEQRVLEAIRRDLDRNYQYELPMFNRDEGVPTNFDQTDTMRYTVAWRHHLKKLQELGKQAFIKTKKKVGTGEGRVHLSKNQIVGGPLILRLLPDPEEENHALLRECETVLASLEHAAAKDDAALLTEVCLLAQVIIAQADQSYAQEIVHFRDDELENDTPKWVSADDLKWLRFMTGRAANQKMIKALTESKFTLYNLFVQRMQNVMDSRNPEGLFHTHGIRRTVEQLLEVMNAGCEDGPNDKTIFNPYQAKLFLERAHDQGLCIYEPDAMVYGWVQRAKKTIHPWDYITFTDRRPASSAGNRFQPQDPQTRAEIQQFFRNLGWRLGWTIHRLRQHFSDPAANTPLPLVTVRRAMDGVVRSYNSRLSDLISDHTPIYSGRMKKIRPDMTWKESQEERWKNRKVYPDKATLDAKNKEWAKMRENPYHLVTLIDRISPEDKDKLDPNKKPRPAQATYVMVGFREAAALHLIRQKVLQEVSDNRNLLARSRLVDPSDPKSAKTWDHNWSWAKPAVRQREVRQYFDVNRWPLNFQSLATQTVITSDEDVETRFTEAVMDEDVLPQYYLREKLRPYAPNDDEVVFRPGTPAYWEGDTVRQRNYVRRLMENKIGAALGNVPKPPPKRNWVGRLAAAVGLPWPAKVDQENKSPDSPPAWDANLPKVDKKLIPKSQNPFDPVVNRRIRRAAGEVVESDEEDENDDANSVENGDVDGDEYGVENGVYGDGDMVMQE